MDEKTEKRTFFTEGPCGKRERAERGVFSVSMRVFAGGEKMKRRESEEACGEENTRKRKLEENKLKN